MPVNNAIGTIVSSTENANIDMVFVAGRLAQMAGQGDRPVDINALRTMVSDSRDYIAARVGFDIRPTRDIRLKHDEIRHRHAGSFDSIGDLLTAEPEARKG